MAIKLFKNNNDFSTEQLPKAYRVSICAFEIVSVILLAFLASKIVTQVISEPVNVPTKVILINSTDAANKIENDYAALKSFDAFLGTSSDLTVNRTTDMPESTLDLKVFGLRSSGNGSGTAILKPQGELQKLYKVGDIIANNVKLAAVYPDHIEINRNSQIEIIYLDKDRSKASLATTPKSISVNNTVSTQAIEAVLDALDLDAYRNNNRISGFLIGDKANKIMLKIAGLEIGDILNSVNGETLHSWERISEITPHKETGSLEIILERRGELINVTVPKSLMGQ